MPSPPRPPAPGTQHRVEAVAAGVVGQRVALRVGEPQAQAGGTQPGQIARLQNGEDAAPGDQPLGRLPSTFVGLCSCAPSPVRRPAPGARAGPGTPPARWLRSPSCSPAGARRREQQRHTRMHLRKPPGVDPLHARTGAGRAVGGATANSPAGRAAQKAAKAARTSLAARGWRSGAGRPASRTANRGLHEPRGSPNGRSEGTDPGHGCLQPARFRNASRVSKRSIFVAGCSRSTMGTGLFDSKSSGRRGCSDRHHDRFRATGCS